ncbi:hypothetical protein NGRA_0209 [Nosema granulosis]|uniref:Uncharacterized protein n=1 Tax=Nosema granulosis TaxID=83296 RepID=A0A9P6H0Q2_9MICR|nr:hypothetical protein NGRA_0209 [Nosema granulosis]
MLMMWLCLLLCENKQETCADGKGAYIINYSVHVNIPAQIAILNYMNSISKETYMGRQATEVFLNSIFDSINRTIEPYNVQILADYSHLHFEELPISLSPEKICETTNAVGIIMSAAKINLSWPVTAGVGNKIILYKCMFGPPKQSPYKIDRIGECGNLAVIHMEKPLDAIKLISDTVEGALTYNSSYSNGPTSPDYIKNLCSYVKYCAVNNDLIGKLRYGLINIKNNPRARISEIAGDRK